jgi:chromosome segregation protein
MVKEDQTHMRLNKLILQGFKSFADRTEFVFDSPITGIVGPNGCGKSNVVDGFKWVLGEQSAKSLRGDAMMDVIFNGSGGRKPAGMAEVVLVFDNPRREDGSRMLGIDADEVAVGRRLFRDGTSEYQINNQSSRLKDIREMFLDTGVGADAYSVIEQGRVSAMLEANPEQRRVIFEEAAGISKFKAKKKETIRKLEKVDQNLLRVNDIVEEVDKRLRGVKIQAGRARTFQEYSTRLRELRLEHALKEYHTQRQEAVRLESAREEARFRLEDVSADLSRRQNELAEQRQTLASVTEQRQRVEYELVQNRAALQSAQQRQQYAQRQLQQIEEQREGFEHDRAQAQEKLQQVQSALDGESARLAELTEQVESRKSTIQQRQQAYAQGQHQLNGLNQQVEQHKQTILDLMRRLATINSRLGAIEIERKNIAQQQHRLGERRRTVVAEVEALEATKSEITHKQEAIAATIAEQQQQLESQRAQAADLGRHIGQVNEQLGAAREHRSGLMSRCKLLEDLETKREGVSEGVKSVLRRRDESFSFIEGLVADVLRVDVEHAHTIEAALDGRDQLLITHDSAALLNGREMLEELEGRINVLCTDRLPEFHDGYDWNVHPQRIRLAADLVRFEPQNAPVAQHLLGRTVVVDALADAMELHRSGPAGYRYVTTPAGEVVEADGTVRAGPLTAAMGLLSRRSELEAVRQQIVEVEGRIEKLTQQLTQDNAQAKQLAEAETTLRTAVYHSNTTRVELNSQLAQVTDKLNALLREQPLLDRELQQWMEQSGKLTGELSTLSGQRTDLEQQQTQHQHQVEQLTESHRATAEQVRQFGEELTAARVELGQVQEKQLAAGQQVQRHKAAVAESAGQIERLSQSARSLDQRQEAVERELQQAQHDQSQLQESIQQLGEKSKQLSEQVAHAEQSVRELTADVERIRLSHANIEQELHAVELQLSELRVKTESLTARVAEELELDLPARYAEVGENNYQPAELDWEAVTAEIKTLREKIQRLGNVNLDSIGEQDELEERQRFLSAQVTDLTQSKLQLEELIDTINTESAQRFEQTFNAVREHFQGMFRKLFGGGKADIYLETELEDPKAAATPAELGPDGQPAEAPRKKIDILDAGIEIIARPPGKQPVSISQLSGGEKTMTCVALLMSIFKSKPSPFCILDEVDAALDEANNQRFNTIVQEFLDQSQFIVITHSKRTMQVAYVLYGVTMQEQGVSKRVAVKFDQVDSQGQLSEHVAA